MKADSVKMANRDTKVLIFSIISLISILAWLVLCSFNVPVLVLIRFFVVMMFGYIAMVTDLLTKRIPNKLILAMLGGWLLITLSLFIYDFDTALRHLLDSSVGFAVGGGLFFAVYLISKKGLGGGDVKFIAAAGLYLGFASIIPVIIYGTTIAALTGTALILLKKRGRKDSMPLAPYLFIGIMITAFLRGFQ